MPVPSTHGQAAPPANSSRPDWFATTAGQVLLRSELASVHAALGERPGQPWLWLAPSAPDRDAPPGQGLRLQAVPGGWAGSVRCTQALPLANESVACVVLQHVGGNGEQARALVAECARVLVPGGRLSLLGLNPLSPWRWRWAGDGPGSSEPMPWRRRMRAAGLVPEAVSQGLGPRWGLAPDPSLQHGPGLRAAWLLRAEKRVSALTPVRARQPLRIGSGVPAA